MWWYQFKNKIRQMLDMDPVFLCDSCRYDHPHVCRRPDRPNALECPDYKPRGG